MKATFKETRNKKGIDYQFTQEEAQKECAKFGETLCPKSVIDNHHVCDNHGWMRDHEFPGYNNGAEYGCGAKGWNERKTGLGNAHCCIIESESACFEKKCKCPNGTPKTGVDCPTDGSTNCKSCNNGYYVTGAGSCALKKCTCSNGTAATGAACPANGGAKCTKCNSGYSLIGGACLKKVNCVAKWIDNWGECSECHNGTQSRTQVIDKPQQNGGAACNLKTESQSCSPGCAPFWTKCYKDEDCDGNRDKCIEAECKSKGLKKSWHSEHGWWIDCGIGNLSLTAPNNKMHLRQNIPFFLDNRKQKLWYGSADVSAELAQHAVHANVQRAGMKCSSAIPHWLMKHTTEKK